MKLSFQKLNALADVAGDAFFVFCPERFAGNLDSFQAAFREAYANSHLAYAFKANYMPALAGIVADRSMYAEVVSRMEFEIAAACLPASRIIFNGPLKRRGDVERALRTGACLNIDSFAEIQALEEIAPGLDAPEVGIRVNFRLAGEPPSRFGFDAEAGQLTQVLARLNAIGNLRVTGLHAHFSTHRKSLASYRERTQRLVDIATAHAGAMDLARINVGGGFFGDLPPELRARFETEPPSFKDYAEVIGGVMKAAFPDEGVQLFFEPGVSVVADSMAFAARILELREGPGGLYALCDASINVTNPTRSSIAPPHEFIRDPSIEPAASRIHLVGNTCMEHDVLCADEQAGVAAGDWVVFLNRGAYSNVYKPPFIAPAPPIVTTEGVLVKRAETATDILRTYIEGGPGS